MDNNSCNETKMAHANCAREYAHGGEHLEAGGRLLPKVLYLWHVLQIN